MDAERFQRAAVTVLGGEKPSAGIGTLGEKTLHAVIKRYLEQDAALHEIRLGRFVADIATSAGIWEIQTRQFNRLRRKLDYYLNERGETVTVVYPVAQLKWLSWLDPATGEATPRRRSPRTGRPQDIFPELYRIRPLLVNPRLRFDILLLEVEELRLLNGWSRDRKRGSCRFNRWPRALLGELTVGGKDGFAALVPEELHGSGPFTSADFAHACHISPDMSRTGLNVLTSTGTVQRVGKRGNSILYTYL